MDLNTSNMSKILGFGLAGALAIGAVNPSSAAPVSDGAAIKQAVPGTVTDVRWRGGGLAAGVGLGILGGAVIAGAYPYRYGYPAYAYYGGPYYGGPYWGPRPYWGWRHRYWHRHWRRW
jgi:hypothetical protein